MYIYSNVKKYLFINLKKKKNCSVKLAFLRIVVTNTPKKIKNKIKGLLTH